MIKFIPSLKFHILLSTTKFNPFPKIRESCEINVVYKEGGDNGFPVNTMSKAALLKGKTDSGVLFQFPEVGNQGPQEHAVQVRTPLSVEIDSYDGWGCGGALCIY